jgi:hypothetical protein
VLYIYGGKQLFGNDGIGEVGWICVDGKTVTSFHSFPERNIREQDFPSLRIIFCHNSHSHLQTQESVGFDRRIDFIQLGSGSSCGIGILQGKSDIRGISDDKAASQLTREGRIAQYVFMGSRKLVGSTWKGTEYYYDYGSIDKQRHFKISPHPPLF